jgi:aminopeptidase-like protein
MEQQIIEEYNNKAGSDMYGWARDLFYKNRSITGEPNRETLRYLKEIVPAMSICEVPSGTQVFDWTVPEEWALHEAYIENEKGERIIDFQNNNLHVISYCEPVDQWMTLGELSEHLYSLPGQPGAIPYITSYYKKRWGFCLSHEQRIALPEGKYHAVVKSEFKQGVLNYGEVILPGKTEKEILISTYICHPSMANNEISGMVVATSLARWIAEKTDRKYTYRILFIPETIGSITYLSKHWKEMKEKTEAGFVITCVGDDLAYSFMPSRMGDTLADKVALYVLDNYTERYEKYSFLQRGSDERQYCSPLIDLPVVSVMRSKYATYNQYHTSLDNLDFISAAGLEGAFARNRECIEILERNTVYKALCHGEPQLGKRGLYNISSNQDSDALINLLAYADGKLDLLDISKLIKTDFFECAAIADLLVEHSLIEEVNINPTRN